MVLFTSRRLWLAVYLCVFFLRSTAVEAEKKVKEKEIKCTDGKDKQASCAPSVAPSLTPSSRPSRRPSRSVQPSFLPTTAPSTPQPTTEPTATPTTAPIETPTVAPTVQPTTGDSTLAPISTTTVETEAPVVSSNPETKTPTTTAITTTTTLAPTALPTTVVFLPDIVLDFVEASGATRRRFLLDQKAFLTVLQQFFDTLFGDSYSCKAFFDNTTSNRVVVQSMWTGPASLDSDKDSLIQQQKQALSSDTLLADLWQTLETDANVVLEQLSLEYQGNVLAELDQTTTATTSAQTKTTPQTTESSSSTSWSTGAKVGVSLVMLLPGALLAALWRRRRQQNQQDGDDASNTHEQIVSSPPSRDLHLAGTYDSDMESMYTSTESPNCKGGGMWRSKGCILEDHPHDEPSQDNVMMQLHIPSSGESTPDSLDTYSAASKGTSSSNSPSDPATNITLPHSNVTRTPKLTSSSAETCPDICEEEDEEPGQILTKAPDTEVQSTPTTETTTPTAAALETPIPFFHHTRLMSETPLWESPSAQESPQPPHVDDDSTSGSLLHEASPILHVGTFQDDITVDPDDVDEEEEDELQVRVIESA